jgi:hypothetical protein
MDKQEPDVLLVVRVDALDRPPDVADGGGKPHVPRAEVETAEAGEGRTARHPLSPSRYVAPSEGA